MIVKTGVDDLLELLASSPKIALSEAAAKLHVPIDVLQAWTDFLVEESIIGVEYRFTTPYIYLNKPIEMHQQKKDAEKDVEEPMTLDAFKKEFWGKARAKNLPEDHIDILWKNHVEQELERKKKYFFFEANNRQLVKIDELWDEYKKNLLASTT